MKCLRWQISGFCVWVGGRTLLSRRIVSPRCHEATVHFTLSCSLYLPPHQSRCPVGRWALSLGSLWFPVHCYVMVRISAGLLTPVDPVGLGQASVYLAGIDKWPQRGDGLQTAAYLGSAHCSPEYCFILFWAPHGSLDTSRSGVAVLHQPFLLKWGFGPHRILSGSGSLWFLRELRNCDLLIYF